MNKLASRLLFDNFNSHQPTTHLGRAGEAKTHRPLVVSDPAELLKTPNLRHMAATDLGAVLRNSPVQALPTMPSPADASSPSSSPRESGVFTFDPVPSPPQGKPQPHALGSPRTLAAAMGGQGSRSPLRSMHKPKATRVVVELPHEEQQQEQQRQQEQEEAVAEAAGMSAVAAEAHRKLAAMLGEDNDPKLASAMTAALQPANSMLNLKTAGPPPGAAGLGAGAGIGAITSDDAPSIRDLVDLTVKAKAQQKQVMTVGTWHHSSEEAAQKISLLQRWLHAYGRDRDEAAFNSVSVYCEVQQCWFKAV